MTTYSDKRYDFSDKAGGLCSSWRGSSAPCSTASTTASPMPPTPRRLIFDALPELNWVGFYFLQGGSLLVGPFQGKPACVRIALGKGVCGAAAAEKRTIVVPDVFAFPGHIACDAASRSEIVVPLMRRRERTRRAGPGQPRPGRFDEADRVGVERLAAVFLESA